jgi:hypothetical protein
MMQIIPCLWFVFGAFAVVDAFSHRPATTSFQIKRHRVLWSAVERDRFGRMASTASNVDAPCILNIHGKTYNVTAWALAHPGGAKILLENHQKEDASTAFDEAGHSAKALEMMKKFEIGPSNLQASNSTTIASAPNRPRPRWITKLFTKEDPIGLHKYCGIFVLLHYVFRFTQMYFFDPSCGMGSRLGKGSSM